MDLDYYLAGMIRDRELPIWALIGMPLAVAVIIHVLRTLGMRRRASRRGDWVGVDDRGGARLVVVLLAYAILAGVLYMLAIWLGYLPRPYI